MSDYMPLVTHSVKKKKKKPKVGLTLITVIYCLKTGLIIAPTECTWSCFRKWITATCLYLCSVLWASPLHMTFLSTTRNADTGAECHVEPIRLLTGLRLRVALTHCWVHSVYEYTHTHTPPPNTTIHRSWVFVYDSSHKAKCSSVIDEAP